MIRLMPLVLLTLIVPITASAQTAPPPPALSRHPAPAQQSLSVETHSCGPVDVVVTRTSLADPPNGWAQDVAITIDGTPLTPADAGRVQAAAREFGMIQMSSADCIDDAPTRIVLYRFSPDEKRLSLDLTEGRLATIR